MNKNSLIFFFLFIFLFGGRVFAQEKGEVIKVIGDSLIGKRVNGRMIREVIGNVVMTQGKVKITCNKAIQYFAENEVELIGNVVAVQDSIVIETEKGYYYGTNKIAYSNVGVSLFDGHVNLTAKNGYYYFDTKEAYFYENVALQDSSQTLTSDRLRYFNESDKAVAAGKVIIADLESSIYADSLINFRRTKTTFAYNNILVTNKKNNVKIFGDELYDEPDSHYTKISGEPLLMQIDTSSNGKLDTLLILSKLMEAVKDSSEKLIASDSVKILRGNFSSVNERSIYFRSEERIETVKPEEKIQPILWFENSQLTGDTVDIYIKDNLLDWINIVDNAFILSKIENFSYRYNQISGDTLKLFFNNESLERTDVRGKALSIYYLFEEDEPNGLIKSSAERTVINFDSSKVIGVNLYGSPESEYHPENLVEGMERDFTLPAFIIFENRPVRGELLTQRRISLLKRIGIPTGL